MAASKYFKFSASQLFLSSVLVFHALGFPLERLKSFEIIREINSKGPYLGLIAVYSLEENAFFSTGYFQPDSQYPFLDLSGRRFRVGKLQGKEVIYVKCGVGMVNAAAATQQMLDLFYIDGLIHFGISGNLNSSLNIGDVIIPNQFVNTGLWDWLKPNAEVPKNDFATLEIKEYNVPRGGNSSLGMIGYRAEQFYSDAGELDTAQKMLWFNVTRNWLQLASTLQGLELENCVNSSLCLENKPKVVLGTKASTANIFLDNGAYRDFLFQTFGVSSVDMESTAVVMVSPVPSLLRPNFFQSLKYKSRRLVKIVVCADKFIERVPSYGDSWAIGLSRCTKGKELHSLIWDTCCFKCCKSCHPIH